MSEISSDQGLETEGVVPQLARDDVERKEFLRMAIKSLGGKPVAMPKFAFPATNQSTFLKLAYTLENVGVGAYNGAGPSLTSSKLLAAAGSIVQVEARHAATIALLTSKPVTPDGAFDKPLTKSKVLADVKPLVK